MNHLERKLQAKLNGTKGARVKASLMIDSWAEADSYQKEKVYRQWAEANRSPYGGRVNRALLSLVPDDWWKFVATIIAEGPKCEDDEHLVNYGLELHDCYDPEDEDDRERLILSAGQSMWNQVEQDIVDAWKANDDLDTDDLPWQVEPEYHDIPT